MITFRRFGLRSALVLLTLICVWLAAISYRARCQREALTRIRELRGSVRFDWEPEPTYKNRNALPSTEPDGSALLRRWFGDEYFQEVVTISVRQMPEQPRINVDYDQLESICKLRSLTTLILNDVGIDSTSMHLLEHLDRLRMLGLKNNAIDDDGLRYLRNMHQLEGLVLSGTAISDSGLRHISSLSSLRELDIGNTSITDQGLDHLAGLNLDALNLSGTAITDEGITHLLRLTELRRLYVQRTKVTEEGVATLQQSLPKTSISYE